MTAEDDDDAGPNSDITFSITEGIAAVKLIVHQHCDSLSLSLSLQFKVLLSLILLSLLVVRLVISLQLLVLITSQDQAILLSLEQKTMGYHKNW